MIKYIAVLLFLSACASLPSKVFYKIKEGDTKSHVEDLLGRPERFAQKEYIEEWYYVDDEDQCGVSFQDGKVLGRDCEANKAYLSTTAGAVRAVGLILKGAGDGTGRRPVYPVVRE